MNKIIYHVNSPDGFGSNFFRILTAINYSLEKNLVPYVDIVNTSYCNIDQNCWNLIFEQPFELNKNDPSICERYSDWDLGEYMFSYHENHRSKFQDKNFISSQRKIVHNYIRPHQYLLDSASNFLNPYAGKKILGVHKRGRDHFSSTGHASGQRCKITNEYLKSIIDDCIQKYDYLYLISDENCVYDFLSDNYGKKLIFFDDKKSFQDNEIGLHFLNIDINAKTKMLKNLIIEILIMAKCDKLLLMNSNVSHMSLLFSKTENFEFYDNHVNYN